MAGGNPTRDPAPHNPILAGFPAPGPKVRQAYLNLWIAQQGTEEEKRRLGSVSNLPRPWLPATCTDRGLRWELWLWLDQVAAWVNNQYSWEPGTGLVPPCWPHHPHIAHELAVLADQRRRAELATTSDVLETWHRYTLPGFLERLRARLHQTCDDNHQPSPGRGRHTHYHSEQTLRPRMAAFEADLATLPELTPPPAWVHDYDSGHDIDPVTGEIHPTVPNPLTTAPTEPHPPVSAATTTPTSPPNPNTGRLPNRLQDLAGPRAGTITLDPATDNDAGYSLDDPTHARALYSRIVRTGTPADLTRLLNPHLLQQLWPTLILPAACRREWEDHFPQLARNP